MYAIDRPAIAKGLTKDLGKPTVQMYPPSSPAYNPEYPASRYSYDPARSKQLLARAGIASRREVERMIADGRVKIGEELVTTPATVLTSLKGVTVDGNPVKAPEPPRLFAFHKPEGLITAERDPAGRPTIYTALRNALPKSAPRVMPVGRLDLNTEGLLLLTNDGELKRAMELPSSGIPRTYRARTFGDITQARLEELIEGVTISKRPSPNSASARCASFSQVISTSPMLRCAKVVVEPRAPVSSTGTLAKSRRTKSRAVVSLPPGWRSA